MLFYGETEKIAEGIRLLELDKNDGIKVTVTAGEDALSVIGANGEYEIKYGETAEFFRGISILKDKINKNETDFLFTQQKKFDSCGVMIDVSRNAVLKVETVKDIIRYMASMGLNMIMLYTEDTYKLDKYPYFGYMRGAYTKDEIKEMVAYGEKFGVELVPCIQTLAHLSKTLKWDYAKDMKDTADILLIGEEKTYEFIEEMIKTCRECYNTEKIHIGMDEAHDVGLGEYLRRHGYRDRFQILSEHLNRVMEITDKYNFKPMMWSDMFFRLGSQTGNYYDLEIKMPENISDIIPEQMSMVYWDYYNNDEKICDFMVKTHLEMGRPVVFAGGIWTWNGLSPNYDKTYITTKAALSACRKYGVKDVFATMWGDDGAECSIYTTLLGLQLYGEYNYNEVVSDELLGEMFKICTGYDADAFSVFNIDDFGDACEEHNATISKQVFYSDVLRGVFDKNLESLDLKSHYSELLSRFDNLVPQKGLEYLFEYQKQLITVLYKKCKFGEDVTKAYLAGEKDKLAGLAKEIAETAKAEEVMLEMLADIWYKNNKVEGFEVLDDRLGGNIARLNRAVKRINAYLNGGIESIPELEEERLFFSGEKTAFRHQYASGNIKFI